MATERKSELSKASALVRRILLVFVVVIGLTGVYYFIRDNINLGGNQTPSGPYSPYLPTDNKFDVVEFPELPSENNYTLSNDAEFALAGTRQFAKFPESIYIYKLQQPREDFSTGDNIQETAVTLGFDDDFREREGRTVTWGNTITRQLTFSRVNLTWDLESNPNYRDKFLVGTANTSNVDQSIIQIVTLIKRIPTLATENYSQTRADYYPILFKENGTIEIDPISEFYYVSMIQNLSHLPFQTTDSRAREYIEENSLATESRVITSNPLASDLTFLFSKNVRKIDQLVEFNYKPTLVEQEPGVYDIISPEEAFQAIQNGNGNIRSVYIDNRNRFNNLQEAEIQELQIMTEQTQFAYLHADEWTGFLHPIYVFYGDARLSNNTNAKFVIYVNALK